MRFWLGTDRPNWLRLTDADLFVSHRVLAGRKTLPRARGDWCCDSGGFSELSTYGEWRTSEDEYADAVARYTAEIGRLAWAAPQDWMCEPWIVEKTGRSVHEHQERTIASYLSLRDRGPFVPVLQGWLPDEYRRHVDMYRDAGVDLAAVPVVGLGSVCRRGDTRPVEDLLVDLANAGIRLHGFGFKRNGLTRVAYLLHSADSMAWSYTARYRPALPGCTHRACSHCLRFALRWRDSVIASTDEQQLSLFYRPHHTGGLMFPGAHAQIIRNDAGEPIGWDYPPDPDDYDVDDYYNDDPHIYDDLDDDDLDDDDDEF